MCSDPDITDPRHPFKSWGPDAQWCWTCTFEIQNIGMASCCVKFTYTDLS